MKYSCDTCGKKFGNNRGKAELHANRNTNHKVYIRWIGEMRLEPDILFGGTDE
jgi:hypothetical protein